jgi:asparagine synthase (glutamine-hydrolysing)
MVVYAGIIGKKDDAPALLAEMRSRIYNLKAAKAISVTGDSLSMVIYDSESEKRRIFESGNVDFLIDGHILPDDWDALFELYEKHGPSFVEHLNGVFNIVVNDKGRDRVIVANDRYGLRPLFYYNNQDYMLFSTQMLPLLVDGSFNKELNWETVAEFFALGIPFGGKTLIDRIFMLSPATIVIYQASQLIFNNYWRFRYQRVWDKEALFRELSDRFIKAVDRFINDSHEDANIGLLLSGGFDSRAVLGAITRPVKTFTFGCSNCPEMRIARRVAKKAHVENEPFILEPESFLRWGNIGIQLIGWKVLFNHFFNLQILDRIQNSDIGVLAHGFAFGELLGGQKLDRELFDIKGLDELTDYTYMKKNFGFSEEMMSRLFLPEYYEKVRGKARRSLERELHGIDEDSLPDIYEHLIFHTDVQGVLGIPACMGIAIEEISPLYDNSLMDTILKIPPEYRYRHKFYLDFFRRTFPTLSAVPYLTTGISLRYPICVQLLCSRWMEYYRGGMRRALNLFKKITRVSIEDKSGKPDLDEWIRSKSEIRTYIEQILLDEKALCKKFFNERYIKEIIERHMSYERDYNPQIFILLSFELFLRNFMTDIPANMSHFTKEKGTRGNKKHVACRGC